MVLLSLTSSRRGRRPDVVQVAAPPTGRARPLTVSVVVPTRNEAGNVAPLVRRLGAALAGELYDAEIIIVDDSDDDTPAVVRGLQPPAGLDLSLVHRLPGQRAGGLGGAVQEGIRRARGYWVVVMDSDLQHPPEVVPRLLEQAVDGVDLVVASRHVPGGDAVGLGGTSRVIVSEGATWLTRLMFPARMRRITDPMSGFFLVRRNRVDVDRLRCDGFKILLEIIIRSDKLRAVEVPFVFADRLSGETKASAREGFRFLRQLVRLSVSRLLPSRWGQRRRRVVGFAAVGLSGIAVNSAALWVLADPSTLGWHYLWAAILATQASTTWNFVLVDRFVFRGPHRMSMPRRAARFMVTNNVVLLVRLPVLAFLVSTMAVPYLFANLITLALSFVTRFGAVERLVYARRSHMSHDDETVIPTETDQDTVVDLEARTVVHLLHGNGNGQASNGNGQASNGNGQASNGNGHASNGHASNGSGIFVPVQVRPDQGAVASRALVAGDGPVPAGGSTGKTDQGALAGPVTDKARRDPVVVLRDAGPAGPASSRAVTSLRTGTGYLPHRYQVCGTVTVASEIALPELEFFRAPWLGRDLDIEIRVGSVGSGGLRGRARLVRFEEPAGIRYEEHFGAASANFAIDMGDRIRITVSPLLARSRHVLYTNVLEAMLRLIFAARGRMLLHSACVEISGVGVMLSARTDTGKTGTILRLLREHDAHFLSDDMTVVDTEGRAYCYPKPLTISSHTLRAVDPGDLRTREWWALNIKSRVHSKGGRGIGLRLGSVNFPIMTVNSLTQMVISPPKYRADRLVPCDVLSSFPVSEMFIIERGADSLEDMSVEDAVQELLDNTDDAYGFPPFRYLAPALTIDGLDYPTLREREREVLTTFVQGIRVRRLRSDSFGWADEIPALVDRPAPTTPRTLVPRPRSALTDDTR
jgi:glycosyltransferase involved in cell wall biosynthesis